MLGLELDIIGTQYKLRRWLAATAPGGQLVPWNPAWVAMVGKMYKLTDKRKLPPLQFASYSVEIANLILSFISIVFTANANANSNTNYYDIS